MAFNDQQNREISNGIIDNLKMNPATDMIPKAVIPTIQPVYEVNNPLIHERPIFGSSTCVNGTASTVFTADTINDTFIHTITLSLIKDVTSTSTFSFINAIVGGANRVLTGIIGLTATPNAQTVTITLEYPIKIDKGTSVSVNNETATGNVSSWGIVIGFIRTV